MEHERSDRGRKRLHTRGLILEAARSLFYERGFAATTVADVASAAGVALQTVFNHVATKEELFFADRAPLVSFCDPILATNEPAGRAVVRALCTAAVDDVASLDDPVLRDMAAQIEAIPSLSRHERTLHTQVEKTLVDYLQATNCVVNPRWTAALLLATTRASTREHRQRVLAGHPVAEALVEVRAELTHRLGSVLSATTTLPVSAPEHAGDQP